MKVALAVNSKKVTNWMSERYSVIADFRNANDISAISNMLEKPDLIIIADSFDNITIKRVVAIKRNYPSIRIIFIMSDFEFTSRTIKKVRNLAEVGIYDILIGGEFSLSSLGEMIENPREYKDVEPLLEGDDSEVYPNITTVASIKPGSGKTFLATNLAVALADYGQDKRVDGRMERPRVLLLDGDLINLSVGVITRVDNYDRNMLTALKKIGQNIEPDGQNNLTGVEVENLKRFVRNCLSVYKGKPNLFIMAASDIPIEDLEDISPAHFYFLVQMLARAFDIVIVDSNSAFDHQTTAALYELSGNLIFLIDNDFNNIQNNIRYLEKLSDLGYDEKIHFVVNKDLTEEAKKNSLEDLDYDTFNIGNLLIEHRIPLGDAGTIKTVEYEGKLLVTTDKAPEVRKAILDVANDIWKIDYSKIEDLMEKETPKKKKEKGKGFFGK